MTGAIHFAMTHSEPGGLREIWNDVGAGLTTRGHKVERFVFYPSGGSDQREAAEAEGWHHVLTTRATGPLGVVRLIFALIRYLRRTKPAAVVTAMPFANVLMPLAVRLAGTGTRVFITHHSPADTHNRMLDRIDTFTGQMACVAAVVCVSNAVSASFDSKPTGYRGKRQTIHNALPSHIEEMIDAVRAKVGEGQETAKVAGRIVALGRLSYQKNYPMLIRAMSRVPLGTLDIVGAGEDAEALVGLARECGVAGRVRFLGLMPREQALAHAATAQIFAQVSHYEGHSLALIEAARMGLPLVVSQVPVQVEGITDPSGQMCGIAVPIGEDMALGGVLSRLLADEQERGQWSERARALGLAASNAAMIDAYESMLIGEGSQ